MFASPARPGRAEPQLPGDLCGVARFGSSCAEIVRAPVEEIGAPIAVPEEQLLSDNGMGGQAADWGYSSHRSLECKSSGGTQAWTR